MIKEIIPDCNLDDEDMSFGYSIYEGDRIQVYGIWSKNDEINKTEDDPYRIGKHIIENIYQDVKSNE